MVVGTLSAASITQTRNVAQHKPDSNVDLMFNRFDPTLGVLTGISISSELEWWGGYYAVDNESDQPSSGDAIFSTTATLSSLVRGIPAGTKKLSSSISQYFELTADNGDDPDSFDIDVPGNDYARINGPSQENLLRVYGSGAVDSSYFDDYIGKGQFAINYESGQRQQWTGEGGNSTSSSPVWAQGSVTVTYYYDVPEPTTWALFGLGATLLVLRVRRRNQRD